MLQLHNYANGLTQVLKYNRGTIGHFYTSRLIRLWTRLTKSGRIPAAIHFMKRHITHSLRVLIVISHRLPFRHVGNWLENGE